MMKEAAVGVFDSGVGGLSVLREIRSLLPNESLYYVADSGAAPYGNRSEAFIRKRALSLVEFFVSNRVKAIVIACNTASAIAAKAVRSGLTIPVVAMEPAVKPATKLTKSGVIGVLATQRTLGSENFTRLLRRYAGECEVIPQPCPGFVEQVEKGDLDGPETRSLVTRNVLPLIDRHVDTLVLGCTHYPFLSPLIKDVAGASVRVVDSSVAVARQLERRLHDSDLLTVSRSLAGDVRFWTSGNVEQVGEIVSRLWGESVQMQALPAEYAAFEEPDGAGPGGGSGDS